MQTRTNHIPYDFSNLTSLFLGVHQWVQLSNRVFTFWRKIKEEKKTVSIIEGKHAINEGIFLVKMKSVEEVAVAVAVVEADAEVVAACLHSGGKSKKKKKVFQ